MVLIIIVIDIGVDSLLRNTQALLNLACKTCSFPETLAVNFFIMRVILGRRLVWFRKNGTDLR